MERLPTQETAEKAVDENGEPDPREAFQWAFVSLPFTGSTPLLIQPEARADWSQLFWDLGFRHHPELQTKKVRAPWRGQQHALNGLSEVVDIDDPEPDPVVIPDPLAFTPHEQAVMAERLYQAGAIGDRVPKHRAHEQAEEGSAELFDPAEHTPATVNGYLMAADPAERRRVVALEMVGKARSKILNRWPGV